VLDQSLKIISVVRPKIHTDSRGRLFEVLRGSVLTSRAFGQIYVFTAYPGQVKGNHVHSRKWEYFLAVRGKGVLSVLDLRSGRRESLDLDADVPLVVGVPPNVAHAFRNNGPEDLVIVAYISEEFDASDPDTTAAPVLEDPT